MNYLRLFLIFFSFSANASIPMGQWQCIAIDAQNKSYEGTEKTSQKAQQKALRYCQKQSTHLPCKTADSFCEQGPEGPNDERCIVNDSTGRAFNATGANACDTAMSLCNDWQFLHGRQDACHITHR